MLSSAQLKAREGKLTGSRVGCLMGIVGETAEMKARRQQAMIRLYRELIGEELPEDLSNVLPVRMGEVTEPLNREWYARKGNVVTRIGEVVVHPIFSWAAATIDGWDDTLHGPVECKHVGGREPVPVVIERYQPQIQWQMEVTCASQCALSIFVGNDTHTIEYIDRDEDYAATLMQRGAQFMECVRKRILPVALEPAPPPVDASKIYDMSGNNEWASSAFVWRESKPAADRCKDQEQFLKSLVPADAKKCHGHGIQITRDRAGRLSLRELQ